MDMNSILAALTGQAKQQTGQLDAGIAAMNSNTDAISRLLSGSLEGAQAATTQATAVAQQKAQLDYEAAIAKEKNTALAGMDPADLNNEYVKSLSEYNAAEAERKSTRQQFDQLSQASLLDNPIDYIFAQLALPQVAARNNAAVDRRDAASRNIAARTAMIKEKESITPVNNAAQVRDLQLQAAAADAQTAQAALYKQEADNLVKIGAQRTEALRLEQSKYTIQRDLLNTELQLRNLEAQREAASEARKMRIAAESERLSAKKIAEAEQAALNVKLADASRLLGLPSPVTITDLKLMPEKQKSLMLGVATSGNYGDSLEEALTTIRSGNTRNIVTTHPGLGRALSNISNGLKAYTDKTYSEASAAGIKLTPEKAAKAAADSYQSDIGQSLTFSQGAAPLNSRKWDDNGIFNPYKPDYRLLISALDSGELALPDNTAVAALRTVATAKGVTGNLSGADMTTMVQTLVRSVADKKIGVDQAAKDFVAMHQATAALNKRLYNYDLLGLPVQATAPMTIEGLGAFGDAQKLDAMDIATVKTAFLRLAASTTVPWSGEGALFR